MTTIQLKQGSTTLTIFSVNVEEQIDKDLINFPLPVQQSDWGTTAPNRMSIDLLSIKRVFTVTGFIKNTSTSPTTTAQEARDNLVGMQLHGGSVYFYYGVSADASGSGYTPTSAHKYYYTSGGNGFTCHIMSLRIKEEKGGSTVTTGSAGYNLPEEYAVTIMLLETQEYS